MMRPVPLLASTLVLSLAGCTASPVVPPGTPQFAETGAPGCFRANEILSYAQGPDGMVNLTTVNGRAFEMHLGPGCPAASWIMDIGLRPWKSLWLCQGAVDKLTAPNPYVAGPCMVSSIREVAPTTLAS